MQEVKNSDKANQDQDGVDKDHHFVCILVLVLLILFCVCLFDFIDTLVYQIGSEEPNKEEDLHEDSYVPA